MIAVEPRTHYVYRAFDAEGIALYVGMTKDPAKRWVGHRQSNKHWLGYVARWRVSGPFTRSVARVLEREEQLRLHPVFGQTPYRRDGNYDRMGPIYPPRHCPELTGPNGEWRTVVRPPYPEPTYVPGRTPHRRNG